jgi:hypothetical protein
MQFERRGLGILRLGEAGAQFDWDADAHETEEAMIAGRNVISQGVLLGHRATKGAASCERIGTG